ncbi:MAG TPA: ATP-binding protein [Usitatibacter sp.]|nr:ATP-binding protein [Usitatibacter sp.]
MPGNEAAPAPARPSALRAIIVTPNDADSELVGSFLGMHGIRSTHCVSLAQLPARLEDDVGCVLMVEEALVEPDVHAIQETVRMQPPWSDMPLVLVTSAETPLSVLIDRVFPESGNMTLLQRPLQPVALVSAVQVALRARERQLQVRDLLAERGEAVRKRDEFLAMLAHELRNPLAPIRNAVFLMSTLNINEPLFVKCRAMIDKQTRHIARLVDDLLDVSRLELGKVELRLQEVDLNAAASAAVETCAPITAAQRHKVGVGLAPSPVVVMADSVRLEQILGNLLINAAKFTPPGGTITIDVRREAERGVVAVRDNGVGIEREMLDSVFELFVQGERSLARTEGGLGIGLTLVRRLVELHHGRVKVWSAGLGEGAVFQAEFPLAHPQEASEAQAAPAGGRSRSKRVLIVEDGADIRESLGMLIEMWNHRVDYAETGPEGLSSAKALKPDVVLIDIGLPGLDGYQVARRIRDGDCPWAREVQLVALTGYGQASDRQRAMESGFDMHLLKPVDPMELEQVLDGRL